MKPSTAAAWTAFAVVTSILAFLFALLGYWLDADGYSFVSWYVTSWPIAAVTIMVFGQPAK